MPIFLLDLIYSIKHTYFLFHQSQNCLLRTLSHVTLNGQEGEANGDSFPFQPAANNFLPTRNLSGPTINQYGACWAWQLDKDTILFQVPEKVKHIPEILYILVVQTHSYSKAEVIWLRIQGRCLREGSFTLEKTAMTHSRESLTLSVSQIRESFLCAGS
jgi:hypothetical protein